MIGYLNIHTLNTEEFIHLFFSTGRRSKQKEKLVKGQAFKMIIWLVTYYEFFVKNVQISIIIILVDFADYIDNYVFLMFDISFFQEHSQALSRVVGEQLKQYIKDEGVVKLIQGFLLPEKLNVQREQPFKLPNEDLKVD